MKVHRIADSFCIVLRDLLCTAFMRLECTHIVKSKIQWVADKRIKFFLVFQRNSTEMSEPLIQTDIASQTTVLRNQIQQQENFTLVDFHDIFPM